MAGADIEFHLETIADEQRFIREYLVAAWDRFETNDSFESGWFWPYGAFAEYESGPDEGFIRLVFEGDPSALVDAEKPHWEGFDSLRKWEIRHYDEEDFDSLLAQQRDAKGEVAGEWDYRLKPLVTRFVLDYIREFSDPLPLIGTEAEVDYRNYGYWVVIHYMMMQAGHDWYNETDACLKAMQNRLKSIAHYRGADPAREEYDRLLATWENHREDLEVWLEEYSTGEGEEP